MTPIAMLGATNAMAAAHGVRNRGLTEASVFGHSPPRAPAKMTRAVCVLAATYELVTLVRKIQVMSGARGEMNRWAAVWNGFGSDASALMWPGPNAMISA